MNVGEVGFAETVVARDEHSAAHDAIGVRVTARRLATHDVPVARLAQNVAGEDGPGLDTLTFEIGLQLAPGEGCVLADDQGQCEPSGAALWTSAAAARTNARNRRRTSGARRNWRCARRCSTAAGRAAPARTPRPSPTARDCSRSARTRTWRHIRMPSSVTPKRFSRSLGIDEQRRAASPAAQQPRLVAPQSRR